MKARNKCGATIVDASERGNFALQGIYCMSNRQLPPSEVYDGQFSLSTWTDQDLACQNEFQEGKDWIA